MFQEVAEICLLLGFGSRADGAVRGGALHKGGPWLFLGKGRSLHEVFPGWGEDLQSFRSVLDVGQTWIIQLSRGVLRAGSSCLLLLRNLMSNPVPLLGQNIFHCLSVEMVFCVMRSWESVVWNKEWGAAGVAGRLSGNIHP